MSVGSRCLTDALRPFVVAPAALVRDAGITTAPPPHSTTDDEFRDERAATVRTIEVGHHDVSLFVGGIPCRQATPSPEDSESWDLKPRPRIPVAGESPSAVNVV
jgi:hypothetical protein